MRLRLGPGRRAAPLPPPAAASVAALGPRLSHRAFLKAAAAALGGALLGGVAASPRTVEAVYTEGTIDTVDRSLAINGNLTVAGSVGIGSSSAPSGTGNLDVSGSISINGTVVVDGTTKCITSSYYAQ